MVSCVKLGILVFIRSCLFQPLVCMICCCFRQNLFFSFPPNPPCVCFQIRLFWDSFIIWRSTVSMCSVSDLFSHGLLNNQFRSFLFVLSPSHFGILFIYHAITAFPHTMGGLCVEPVVIFCHLGRTCESAEIPSSRWPRLAGFGTSSNFRTVPGWVMAAFCAPPGLLCRTPTIFSSSPCPEWRLGVGLSSQRSA